MRGGSRHESLQSHSGSFTHKGQGHNTDSNPATMRTRLLSETGNQSNRTRPPSSASCHSNKSVKFTPNASLCNSHSYNESIRFIGHMIKSHDKMPVAVCESNGQSMRVVNSNGYSEGITTIGTAV